MDRLANPAAELRLRLIYQDDRSWLVPELDGAPLPIASLDFDERLPDDLRFTLHTLSGWCREAARPESERAALEYNIGRVLAGILFTDDGLLRSLAGKFPERPGFAPERRFQPDSRNRLRHDLEAWLDARDAGTLRVLVIDDEHPRLAGLPWEMTAWDHRSVPVRLGLERRFALARLRPLPAAIPSRPPAQRPLRMFYVAARERDLDAGDSRLTHHIRRLQEQKHEATLRRLNKALDRLPGGSSRYFRKLLDTDHLGTTASGNETCTLLHVEAHGIRPKDYWQGILTHEELRDDDATATADAEMVARTVTAGALIDGLGDAGTPAVAFLGTCYGGQGEPAEWRRESRRSLGERLLEIGVGAVVGANGGILTTEIPDLTGDFYDELADGATVDRAAQTMRRRIFQRSQRPSADETVPPERWWRPMVLARGPNDLQPFDEETATGDRKTDTEVELRLVIEAGAEGPRVVLEDDNGQRRKEPIPSRLWRRLRQLAAASEGEPDDREASLAAGQAILAGSLGRTLDRRLRDLAAIGRRTVLSLDLPPALRRLPWQNAWWLDTAEAVLKPPSDERMQILPGHGIAVHDWPRTLAAATRIEIGSAGLATSEEPSDPRFPEFQTVISDDTSTDLPATYPEAANRLTARRASSRPWLDGLGPAIWWDVFDGFPAVLDALEETVGMDQTERLRTLAGEFGELPPEANPSEEVGHDLASHLASLAPPLADTEIADLVAWSESVGPQTRDLVDGLRSRLNALDDGERDQLLRVSVLRGFQPRAAWHEVLGRDPASLIERLGDSGLALTRIDELAAPGDRWLIPRLVATLCRLDAPREAVCAVHRAAALRYVPADLLEVGELAKSTEEERYADAAPGGRLGLSALDWFEARCHWLRADPEGLEVHWCDRHIERWLVPSQVPFLMEHSHRCVARGTEKRRGERVDLQRQE